MADDPQNIGNSFTEVSTQSWLSRISGSISGIFFGPVLIIIAFYVLGWNEGRSVDQIKNLDEGSNLVISVPAEQPDPANNGKLIHIAGQANTNEMLSDETFYVSVNAIKLDRVVEMYQWKENEQTTTQNQMGGSTQTTKNYSYTQAWSQMPMDSASFKHPEGHANPAMPYRVSDYSASSVKVGGFLLTSAFIGKLANYKPYPVTQEIYNKLNPEIAKSFKLDGTQLYSGNNSATPAIGDVRVSFRIVAPGEMVSLIGKQDMDKIEPFYTKTGSISLLSYGDVDPTTMFAHAKTGNAILTWVLRFVGWGVMYLGFKMILGILEVIADVLPIFGMIVGLGTGLISLMLASVLSLATIAIAWIAYRPVLGISLFLVAGVLAAGVVFIKKNMKAKTPLSATKTQSV